jgi:hypothetical protein
MTDVTRQNRGDRYPLAPSLQALVERYGSYAEIPREAWAEYDATMALWHIDRRIFTAGYADTTNQRRDPSCLK